jgi:hypothetical protein
MFCQPRVRPDRAAAAQSATAGKPLATAGWQAPSFAALPRAHVFRHLQVAVIRCRPDQANGPARAFMSCLVRWWMAKGLLDGLSTAIRFRLSSRAWEGVWVGPDAMAVGVVFAGWIGPVNLLPILIRIAVACPSAGPDAMLVGVVFTGSPALTSGPEDELPVRWASSGRLARRWRVTHPWCAAWNLVGSGWPSAAMMPILSKSVGGDRPQYPVAKSTRFWRRAVRSVLAMTAGDEARAATTT